MGSPSRNVHSQNGKKQTKRVPIEPDEAPVQSRKEILRRLAASEGQGFTKLPNMLIQVIHHDDVAIISWLIDRSLWLSDRKGALGPKYRGWNYLTTKEMIRKWPFLARGKKNEKSSQMAVTYLFKRRLDKWVETMTGDALAKHLDVEMPTRLRALRWYRIKARKLQRAVDRARVRMAEAKRKWEERKRKVQNAEADETTIRMAHSLYDAMVDRGDHPSFNERAWARKLARLIVLNGEKVVEKGVACWTMFARMATRDGEKDMKSAYNLPNLPDVDRFCSPKVFGWISNRAGEEIYDGI